MNQQTIDMLTEMKMTAMAAEFANQIQDASFNSIGFEERLSMLVTAEWNRRQNNKVTRLMRNAEFGIPSAVIEEIEYHEDRKLDKAQLLRLAACNYIDSFTQPFMICARICLFANSFFAVLSYLESYSV